jgi:serine/threonine protein kinase
MVQDSTRISAPDLAEKTVELRGVERAQPLSLRPGEVLAARYQIEAPIGEGGSGQVFRAWDRVLGEPVALKLLRADRAQERSWIKRLAREVKVARAIRHPNVCRVFDLGSSDGHWYVSMELAAGGALRDALRSLGERPLAARIADARAICAGLAAIHAVGITHRDVTPQNVLRMADGRLVLSDFGLATDGLDTTMHGGTPSYMPPEASMGERPSQRSDVWQLGLIVHEVLFGRRPEWEQGPHGMSVRPPVDRSASAVEQELARLCSDCLAPNPAERPATAMVVAGRLAAAELARSRSPAARMFAGTRKLITSVRGTIALAAVVAALMITAALARPMRRPGVWDLRAREAARRAFLDSGEPGAAAAFEQVDKLFVRYAGARR